MTIMEIIAFVLLGIVWIVDIILTWKSNRRHGK